MIYLILTHTMKQKIIDIKNIDEFRITPKNKYIKEQFYIRKRDIKISIYQTNILNISGQGSAEFYSYLIKNCNEEDTVGMDEVGIGDFFGPEVYVSVLLTKESLNKIAELYIPIKDSKQLKELEIIHICKSLIGIVNYKYKIVYNSLEKVKLNAVAKKCYYHNQNIYENKETIIDLFTTENAFFKYTKELNLKWPEKLILETKADSKYISVALASIIARGIFIIEMKKLSKKYSMKIPYGANVKKEAIKFIDMYGKKELGKIAKTSFKTFDELEERK